MDELQPKAVEFLIAIARISNAMKMYNAKHPVVKKGAEEAGALLAGLLALVPQVVIGRRDGRLIVMDSRLHGDNPAAEKMMELLEARSVSSVSFDRGTTAEELVYFLEFTSRRVDEVLEGGRIKPELLAPLVNIRLNEIQYRAVGADGMVADGAGGDVLADAMLSKMFESELANPQALGATQLAAIFEKMVPFMGAAEGGAGREQARGYFEDTFGRLATGSGLSGMRQTLLGTVMGMRPEAQQALFGRVVTDGEQAGALLRTFALDRRAAMIAADLPRASGTPAELREALRSLLASPAELVDLVGQVGQRLPADAAGRKQLLERLSLALGGAAVSSTPGLVYIADPDLAHRSVCEELLAGAGVQHRFFDDGGLLLRAIATERPDVVVLDVKLAGQSGLDVIATLDRERKHVPVILCTAMASVREQFEVKMYPRLAFLPKPVEPARLLHALRAALPRAGGGAARVGEREAELADAREVQARLVPNVESLPKIPGYELSAFYRASSEIGGDYLDVIPLDETHLGVFVGDVSGKGAASAMVMVMLRSIVRMLATQVRSPRELLARANALLGKDMRRGMFVSAAYGVLDLPTCSLELVSAGHLPAVTYDKGMGLALLTEIGGIPLGLVKPERFEPSLKEQKIQLRKGDGILFYSDGVIESRSPTGAELGEERLRKLVNVNGPRGMSIVAAGLLAALERHQGMAPQHDDIAILTIGCLVDPAHEPHTRRLDLAALAGRATSVEPVVEAVAGPDARPVPTAGSASTATPSSPTDVAPLAAVVAGPATPAEPAPVLDARERQTQARSLDALKRVLVRKLVELDRDQLALALATLDHRQLSELMKRAQEPPGDAPPSA